jgi:hypothetical protein
MPEADVPCRIMERRPAPGDIHPINARQIHCILPRLEQSYLYGLTAIELRPRVGNEIGRPYGEYLNDENVVRLYSLPFPRWRLSGRVATGLFDIHGASIASEGDDTIVHWPRLVDLGYFMYEVLLHELGHHHHRRYRTKRPHPRTPAAKESSAEHHARKLAKNSSFRGWFEGGGTCEDLP